MNQDYIIPNDWSIIEEGFDRERVKSSESLFSIGNGAMGQRANFEEQYSGKTFQGSYIAGIYYPDKTKVGWWKNGYPEYFAKVLNAPNWIGIDVEINGEHLDLNTAKAVRHFRRELNMKEGWLSRSFMAQLQNGTEVEVSVLRFLSLELDEVGAIRYQIKPLNQAAKITYKPYVDSGVKNEDANWEETFWEPLDSGYEKDFGFVQARTYKTLYNVVTFMESATFVNGNKQQLTPKYTQTQTKVQLEYELEVQPSHEATLIKFGGYVVSTNHPEGELLSASKGVLKKANEKGFESLLQDQKEAWAKIWEMADITIEGDTKAQQGIRFNIFQLNQTYLGKDARLNIGPKGFTGEKYGGSTYWDTEAYCLPFYMATKDQNVARNLLVYRYNQLDKAIANAQKLGFTNGAALYPMVTMTGEECHNEWEITFEEIHRNGAIAYAIYNYVNYTDDKSYIIEYVLEVLIAIARFWSQRVNFSVAKKKYVMLGVTGPNEYENNVNNNWYTNYIARWCLQYTLDTISWVKRIRPEVYTKLTEKIGFDEVVEIIRWTDIIKNMYIPYDNQYGIFLQQEGYFDKEIRRADELLSSERPINQHWSWDRILRSCFIKQADVVQGLFMFEHNFEDEVIRKNFDFYEPRCVHESSLSPSVHSVVASKLRQIDKAYELYVRTARLDLDDYNKEAHEGLHITSMAGSWLALVYGFAGMRVETGKLCFNPLLPQAWTSYSFTILFRSTVLHISVSMGRMTIASQKGPKQYIIVGDAEYVLNKGEQTEIDF